MRQRSRTFRASIRRLPVILAVTSLAGFAPGAANADVYYFKDENGVFHFSSKSLPNYQRFAAASPPSRAKSPRRRATRAATRRPKATHYDGLIRELATRHGVEPALVKAVVHAESRFNPRAVSRKGARGLMQLMPATARSYGIRNLDDPRENLDAGIRHLRRLLDRFGENLEWTLAAYNAGSGAVARYGGVPPYGQTQRYVDSVLAYHSGYREIDGSDVGQPGGAVGVFAP